jgi:hypothetical protein
MILQGAPSLGAGGLLRWYLFHVLLLPLLLGILFFVHYYKVVLHGLSLPPSREKIGEDTAKRVPRTERTYFMPDIFTSELMWTALVTLLLTAGSLWFWDAPLEHHADPIVTPLHVVAPWYLAWSQGWLKLADKTLVVAFIPALIVAFTLMPYFEVGKSRRYADRRLGISISMLFIAFMLASNWMGSPEYRVESSPELEVVQELLPQEGPSLLLGVPYEALAPGEYDPGQEVLGNPHLTEALEEYQHAMERHSCTLTGDPRWDSCKSEGEGRYTNRAKNRAIPDPETSLSIEEVQPNLKTLTLHFDAVGVDLDWSAYRHADSNYEEECRFFNKNC